MDCLLRMIRVAPIGPLPICRTSYRMSHMEFSLSTLPTKVLLCSWEPTDGVNIPDEESLKSLFPGFNVSISRFDSK